MRGKKHCAPNPLSISIYEMFLRALETSLKSLNAVLPDSSPSIFQLVVKNSLNKVLSTCTEKTSYFMSLGTFSGRFFLKKALL